jgi:hypothetical protein
MPTTTSVFSEAELAYLQGARGLGRIATVGRDGTPHAVRVGMWSYNPGAGHARRHRPRLRALIRIHPQRVVSWRLGG